MYKKVSTDLNFVDREKQTEKFWEDNDIFRKSMRDREGNEIYMFYDGPPTANGKPHIGHVLTRVIKDMIPRYRTMKGYEVPRKAGWDTHGLPVELEVEKLLGLDGKDQIEKYEFWGLVLFVGIPLPGTGAWTGTLAASILDMDFKSTIIAVMLGVLLAGIIMMVLSVAGFGMFLK